MSNPVETPPVKLDLPVEVIGADIYGRQFLESTRTLGLHRQGLSVQLNSKLARDSEVIVRNPDTNQEGLALVVEQSPGDPSGTIYGLAFLDPSADLWSLQFAVSGLSRIVHLECTGCGSVRTLSLSDIDIATFGATHELIRWCDTCNSSGIWRETSLEVRARRQGPASARKANSASAQVPGEDRRKSRRTTMKTLACVRFSGMEVVVDCEDVSKGGFRFRSKKQYPQGFDVEVAVPYAKSSTNIFCAASISYCHKLPDGQFRHGVTYIKSRGSLDHRL